MKLNRTLPLAALLLSSAVAMLAHHSFDAEFDRNKPFVASNDTGQKFRLPWLLPFPSASVRVHLRFQYSVSGCWLRTECPPLPPVQITRLQSSRLFMLPQLSDRYRSDFRTGLGPILCPSYRVGVPAGDEVTRQRFPPSGLGKPMVQEIVDQHARNGNVQPDR